MSLIIEMKEWIKSHSYKRRIYCKCDYDYKETIKKYGFKYDGIFKKWFVSNKMTVREYLIMRDLKCHYYFKSDIILLYE